MAEASLQSPKTLKVTKPKTKIVSADFLASRILNIELQFLPKVLEYLSTFWFSEQQILYPSTKGNIWVIRALLAVNMSLRSHNGTQATGPLSQHCFKESGESLAFKFYHNFTALKYSMLLSASSKNFWQWFQSKTKL